MKQEISKEMTIEEIFTTFPSKSQRLAQEMTNFGLHCVGCSAATWETLEAGLLGHGKGEEELQELLKRMNSILQEKQDSSKISLTERAAEKFKEILEEEKKEGWALRLGEKPAGCSGFEHTLDFAEKPLENDLSFESNGVKIVIDQSAKDRLMGTMIDFVDGLQGAGFKIMNPNAKSSCGCGSSHGY